MDYLRTKPATKREARARKIADEIATLNPRTLRQPWRVRVGEFEPVTMVRDDVARDLALRCYVKEIHPDGFTLVNGIRVVFVEPES